MLLTPRKHSGKRPPLSESRPQSTLRVKWPAAGLVCCCIALLFGTIAGLVATTGFVVYAFGRKTLRRWPQATGSALALVATATMALATNAVGGPMFYLSGSPDLASGLFLATVIVGLLVWSLPLAGVHRGWTTLVAVVPIWIGSFVALANPAHTAWVSAGVMVASLLMLAWQMRFRHRQQSSSTPRRMLRGVVFVLAGVIGFSVTASLAPQPAQAWNPFSDFRDEFVCTIAAPNTSPQAAGTGPETFLGNQNFVKLPAEKGVDVSEGVDGDGIPLAMDRPLDFGSNLNDYTLYEISGLRGLKFINWSRTDAGDSDCAYMPFISVTLGNFVNTLATWSVQAVIFIKEYAATKNPFVQFFDPLMPVANSMLTIFYSLIAVVLLAVVFQGMVNLRQGLSQALNKFGSGIVAIVVVTSAYGGTAVAGSMADNGNGFFTITNVLDSAVGSLSSGISTMMLSQLPDKDTSMCIAPAGGGLVDSQRYSSCLLAESLAYKPWAKATFGGAGEHPIAPVNGVATADEAMKNPQTSDSPLPCWNNYQECQDMRSYLIAQEGGPNFTDKMEKCFAAAGVDEGDEPTIDARRACDPYYAVAENIFSMARGSGDLKSGDSSEQQGKEILAAYRGDGTFPHFQNAAISMLSILIIGIIIAVLGIATLWKHAELLLLFLFGPVIMLAGAVKADLQGTSAWFKQILGTFVSLLAYSIMSTFAVLIVAWSTTMGFSMGQQLIIMALLLFGFFKMYTKVNQRIDTASGTEQAPGMDRGVNSLQRAATAGAAYGLVRTAPRAIGRIPGATMAVGRGMDRAADKTIAGGKNTARVGYDKAIKPTGKFVNRNTQGAQHLAAGAVGAIAGRGMAGATAIKKNAADSKPVDTVRNAGAKAKQMYKDSAEGGFVRGVKDKTVEPAVKMGRKIRQDPNSPDENFGAARRGFTDSYRKYHPEDSPGTSGSAQKAQQLAAEKRRERDRIREHVDRSAKDSPQRKKTTTAQPGGEKQTPSHRRADASGSKSSSSEAKQTSARSTGTRRSPTSRTRRDTGGSTNDKK